MWQISGGRRGKSEPLVGVVPANVPWRINQGNLLAQRKSIICRSRMRVWSMNDQCHLPTLARKTGGKSSICHTDVTHRPFPQAESQSHISLCIISFGCVGRRVSKICIVAILIAALASKIFSYCWLSPPLKCEHLEPSCTFPFVFQWTSLEFPSSHGAAGFCDLIICCNHVITTEASRCFCVWAMRVPLHQSPPLQFGPKWWFNASLCVETKVWTTLRQQTGKLTIHPPPA